MASDAPINSRAGQRVNIWCTPAPEPVGGVAVLHRIAEVARDLGYGTTIVHTTKDRCWYETPRGVTEAGIRDVVVSPDDVNLVPEVVWPYVQREFGKTVAFCQGGFVVVDKVAGRSVTSPALVASVSELCSSQTAVVFPDVPSLRFSVAVDAPSTPPTAASRDRTIAYMPRRRKTEVSAVTTYLRRRLAGRAWNLLELDGMPHADVQAALGRAHLFLSFSDREGLGLPPLEAMAQGAYVVGFDGSGGREYFDDGYASPIPDGDLLAYATEVLRLVDLVDRDPLALDEARQRAWSMVTTRYSPAVSRSSIEELLTTAAALPARGSSTLTGSELMAIPSRPGLFASLASTARDQLGQKAQRLGLRK